MTEPKFYVYDRDPLSVSSQRSPLAPMDLFLAEPRTTVRGWNALDELLDKSLRQGTDIYWLEIGQQNAPIHTICEPCDRTTQTNSEERLTYLEQMHANTGCNTE